MSKLFGLRNIKKARIKLNILNTTLDMLNDKAFDDILINEICEHLEISKVTFHNYFPQKQELLIYFMQVWCFHRTVEKKQSSIIGFTALSNLFQKASDTPNASFIMLSLANMFTHYQSQVLDQDLSGAEKHLLYPTIPGIETISTIDLDQMIFAHLNEAVQIGEIPPNTNLIKPMRILLDIFYGTPIISQIYHEHNLSQEYKTRLDLVFYALRNGFFVELSN
jgi:hypothetical protein